MNLSDIYKGINYLTNKDVSGLSLTPDQVSLVCSFVQQSIHANSIQEFKRPSNQPKQDTDISLFIPLEELAKTVSLSTPYTLPTDFFFQIAVSTGGLDCEILDAKSWSETVKNPFYEPLPPPVKIEQGKIVLTTVPTTIDLVYYRQPIQPFFDYIIDQNGVVVYMETKSLLVTNGANLDLVRAVEAYANSTAYAVGKRLTYGGLAWEVNTAVLNTNTVAPVDNPNSSFTLVGNIVISAIVTHLLPAGTNGYVSASVELDIPQWAYPEFIQEASKWAISNLTGGLKQ